MKRLLLFVLVLSIALLLLFINTVRQPSLQPAPKKTTQVVINMEEAAQRLSSLLQFPSISTQMDDAAFSAQTQHMQQHWPTVYDTVSLQTFNQHSQLLTWTGTDASLEPLLLLAHLDVVPAKQQSWQQPPFSGNIVDGEIWGRGALDDKGSATAILEAIAALIEKGFRPRRTVMVAFGHDEEVGGTKGAVAISQYLKAQMTSPWMTLDEGGFVLSNGPLPVSAPVALVGIAEKGYLSVRITATAESGHASMPPRETAVFHLANALNAIEASPFKASLDGPANQLFDWLTAETPWPEKLLFANRWLFSPLIIATLEKSPGGNAMLRTTQAPTLLNAGIKDNVLPETASAVINLRLHPRDSGQQALGHLRKVIDNEAVTVEPLEAFDNSSTVISPTDHPAFKILAQSIRNSFPDALVAPYLMVATSDSRHYTSLANRVYRFLPFRLDNDELKRLHGRDERISLRMYQEAIQFYANLIILSSDTQEH